MELKDFDFFKSYEITGTLLAGNLTLPCKGSLLLAENNICQLNCQIQVAIDVAVHFMQMLQGGLIGSFSGKTNDEGAFSIEKVYVNNFVGGINTVGPSSINLIMSPGSKVEIIYSNDCNIETDETIFFLTNLLFGGDEGVQTGDNVSQIRTSINIEKEAFYLLRLGDFDVLRDGLAKRLTAITSVLVIKFDPDFRGQFERIIWPFCFLCSLGQRSFTSAPFYGVRSGKTWKKKVFLPIKTHSASSGGGGIDFRRIGFLKQFVQDSYANYMKWKDVLRLDVVTEYCVQSSMAEVTNVSYLLMAVGLECLADYAKEYLDSQGVDFTISSFQRNQEILIKFLNQHGIQIDQKELVKLVKSVSYNKPGLKEKIVKLLEHLKIPFEPADFDFIEIRNTLVHTGNFPSGMDSPKELFKFQDVYDKFIFAILGYRGERVIRSQVYRIE